MADVEREVGPEAYQCLNRGKQEKCGHCPRGDVLDLSASAPSCIDYLSLGEAWNHSLANNISIRHGWRA